MSITPASLFLIHEETGQRYPIKGEVHIGSRYGDIVFANDKSMSPKHLRLRTKQGHVAVYDLDSTLGTRVNGHHIRPKRPHILQPGDRITVGEQVLTFEVVSRDQRARLSRPRGVHRERSPHPLGPEQFVNHLLILTLLGTFIWQFAHHQPLMGALPEQIVGLGANSNPFTTNGEWWRLITSLFLHYNLLQTLGDAFALFVFAETVARANGGRSLLLIFFFSGFAAGVAALTFNPATAVMAGSTGAIAGLGGALIALLRLGRVRRRHLRVTTPLAILALTLNSLGFDYAPFDVVSLAAGVVAGFMAQLALDYFEAEKAFFQELLVGAGLAALCFALTTIVPQKKIVYLEGSSNKITSPYEAVENEMSLAMENYARLGQQVHGDEIKEPRMAEIIRVELIPRLTRVKAKLEIIKPSSEGERRKIELDQRLVTALLAQVTAMAKFSASRDPKQNEAVEKWTIEVEQLSVEWKRLKAAPPRPEQ